MQVEMEKGGQLFFDLFVAMVNHLVSDSVFMALRRFDIDADEFRMMCRISSRLVRNSLLFVATLILPTLGRSFVACFFRNSDATNQSLTCLRRSLSELVIVSLALLLNGRKQRRHKARRGN